MDRATMRWLAVVPSAVIAYLVSFFIGVTLMDIAQSYCPPSQVVSGTDCSAPWSRDVELGIMSFGAALAGFLLVAIPALVAPSQRTVIARTIFIGGTALALVGAAVGAYVEATAAIVAGLLALYIVTWREKRHDA
jgi:hypothetical protein